MKSLADMVCENKDYKELREIEKTTQKDMARGMIPAVTIMVLALMCGALMSWVWETAGQIAPCPGMDIMLLIAASAVFFGLGFSIPYSSIHEMAHKERNRLSDEVFGYKEEDDCEDTEESETETQ